AAGRARGGRAGGNGRPGGGGPARVAAPHRWPRPAGQGAIRPAARILRPVIRVRKALPFYRAVLELRCGNHRLLSCAENLSAAVFRGSGKRKKNRPPV